MEADLSVFLRAVYGILKLRNFHWIVAMKRYSEIIPY